MTDTYLYVFNCPLCDLRTEHQLVRAGSATNHRKATDFYEPGVPLADMVVACPCGFTVPAWEADYLPDSIPFNFSLVTYVPPIRRDQWPGSAKWELAARTASQLQHPATDIAHHWMRAAWMAMEEGDTEAERYYRLRAVERLVELAQETSDAQLCYLTGEMYRRIGMQALAVEWFQRVPSRTTEPWLARAARQQSQTPQEWF